MRVKLVAALATAAALAVTAPAVVPAQEVGAEQVLGLDKQRLLGEPQGPPLTGEQLLLQTEELTALMRCPVCQGLSVADSPTDSALAMKQEASDLLAVGYTDDQILEYFEQSYGEFIRLKPKARGFNIVVWIAPLVGLLAGAGVMARRLRRSRASVAADDDLSAYRERVRREVSG